jgi:hypothetical protein
MHGKYETCLVGDEVDVVVVSVFMVHAADW